MNLNDQPQQTLQDSLTIAGTTYRSRLLVGRGKYRDQDETRAATEASGAQIITVALRRVNIVQDPNAPSLLDVLPPAGGARRPGAAGGGGAGGAGGARQR